MTSGERMVWAAEFVRARGMGCPIARAAEMASEAVYSLQTAVGNPKLQPDAMSMLQDIIGNGADR